MFKIKIHSLILIIFCGVIVNSKPHFRPFPSLFQRTLDKILLRQLQARFGPLTKIPKTSMKKTIPLKKTMIPKTTTTTPESTTPKVTTPKTTTPKTTTPKATTPETTTPKTTTPKSTTPKTTTSKTTNPKTITLKKTTQKTTTAAESRRNSMKLKICYFEQYELCTFQEWSEFLNNKSTTKVTTSKLPMTKTGINPREKKIKILEWSKFLNRHTFQSSRG